MKNFAFIFLFFLVFFSAGAVQAQSTTSGRAETFSSPPARPEPTQAFTLKKFKDKTEKKKYKREKPLKSKSKYNHKKAAKRTKRY
ncbi:hypothetical protein BH24BAC1_BH24BAC1_31680 [soil metagenome]